MTAWLLVFALAPLSFWLWQRNRSLKKKLTQTRMVDGKIYKPPMVELLDAKKWAHEQMDANGWKMSDYFHRWKDCDDYAELMSSLMKTYIRSNEDKRAEGIAIAPFGYTRTDGLGHVCVECLSDEGQVFFEVYPGYGEPLELTKKEKASARWRNF